jgi:TolB-like protein
LKFIIYFIASSILFFSGCSSVQVNKSKTIKPTKDKIIAIVPYYNYTQTPYAGFSAASISDVILHNHGFKTKTFGLLPKPETIVDENSHGKVLEEVKKEGIPYTLEGKVTEWRYKTGIDAEPVVGFVVKIIDNRSGETLFSSTGSKDALGAKSIANSASEVLEKILP